MVRNKPYVSTSTKILIKYLSKIATLRMFVPCVTRWGEFSPLQETALPMSHAANDHERHLTGCHHFKK
jgi:hypothetical protein